MVRMVKKRMTVLVYAVYYSPPYLGAASPCLLNTFCDRCAHDRGGDSLLFKMKLFVMVFLMVVDIGLNSSVEHEAFGVNGEGDNEGTVLALILG